MAGQLLKLTAREKADIVTGGEKKLWGVYPGHITRELRRAMSRKPMLVEETRYKRMCIVYGWGSTSGKTETKTERKAVSRIIVKGPDCKTLIGMAWTSVHAAEELLRKAMEKINEVAK